MKTIEVSGYVRAETGIGVIQRMVYPLLRERFTVVEASSREKQGRLATMKGIVEGLRAGEDGYDGHLCIVSPLPLRFSRPLVTVVHDLRWRREATLLKAAYRKLDLARIVRLSDTIICVSDTTRRELIEVFPNAEEKSVVAWLGPGITGNGNVWKVGVPGQLLLVGKGRHKRNELAASVLGYLRPDLITSVVGVGVSDATKVICEHALGPQNCTWLSRISDNDLIAQYQTSQYYAHFGVNEGFGLPFVEALKSGAIVVAIDQPLTREILGESAILVPDADAHEIADAWSRAKIPSEEVRRRQGDLYSWDSFADAVSSAILENT